MALPAKPFQNLHIPSVPPKGFDPLNASNEALARYGLPTQPEKANYPRQHAQWEKLMSRPLTFISPEFDFIERNVDRTEPVISPETRLTLQHYWGRPVTSRIWSGAVNTPFRCGDKFKYISATWAVPKAYPPNSQWTGTGWKSPSPYQYSCGIWIGIDGFHSSHDVLQAGTGQRCHVTKDGQLIQETLAWFEWYPQQAYFFKNFVVESGDEVVVIIQHTPSKTNSLASKASLTFINESKCTYTATSMDYTATSVDKVFKGDTAEWIVEGHIHTNKNGSKESTMPYIGTTFMNDCLATTEGGDERNLGGAKMIDLILGGLKSFGVKENDNLLGVYPRWRVGNLLEIKEAGV